MYEEPLGYGSGYPAAGFVPAPAAAQYPAPAIDPMRMRMKMQGMEAQQQQQQQQQGDYGSGGGGGDDDDTESLSSFGGSSTTSDGASSSRSSTASSRVSTLLKANRGGIGRETGSYIDEDGNAYELEGRAAKFAGHVMRGIGPRKQSRR
jgi:hypothetical protein